MSFGKSGSSQQSQSTSSSQLNPQVLSAILGNYAGAKNLVSNTSYQPVNAADISAFQSPYTQSVANATGAQLENLTQQQTSQNGLTAAASGAYNNTRLGVQNALTNQLEQQTDATTLANLNNTGFQTAASLAQTQNAAQNQFPIALQQLLNQSLGLGTSATQSNSQSTGSGSSSSTNINAGQSASSLLSAFGA